VSDKKKVELTRQTFISGELKKVGEVVELPHLEANYMVNSGFAKGPEAKAEKGPEKKAPAKKAK